MFQNIHDLHESMSQEIRDTAQLKFNCNKIVNGLIHDGYSIQKNIFPEISMKNLTLLFQDKVYNHEFNSAAIGSSGMINSEIRSDKIYWLEKSDFENQLNYFDRFIERLTGTIRVELFISLHDSEFHLAEYEPGTFYKRHLDQHKKRSNRMFTIILYLNENWSPEYGGQLRIYTKDGHLDVLPEFGTLVIFRSDLFEHEVLPTTRSRKSLTGWLLKQESELSKIGL